MIVGCPISDHLEIFNFIELCTSKLIAINVLKELFLLSTQKVSNISLGLQISLFCHVQKVSIISLGLRI